MKITQAGVTALLTTIASAAAPVLPFLVERHVITATLAVTIGGVFTALTAGWHSSAVVTKRQAAALPGEPVTVAVDQAVPAEPAAPVA